VSAPRLPGAVAASLTARIKTYANETGQQYERVQRRFVMGRFLARVFTADPDGWLLKGGTGMMVRLPQARYSKDIDIMSTSACSDEEAYASLRNAVRQHHIDPFAFELGPPHPISDGKGTRVTVVARLGARQIDSFRIDLVSWQGVVGAVEEHSLPQAPRTDDFPDQPTIRLYPIADKLCALYELRATTGSATPSTRYRDLVDLLLISSHLQIDLAEAVAATERQRQRRNQMTLPAELASPAPAWERSWAAAAADSPLPQGLHDYTEALAAAARCYLILQSLPDACAAATWNPSGQRWDTA